MDLSTEDNSILNPSQYRTLNNKSGASERDTKGKFNSSKNQKDAEKRLLHHRAMRYSSREWETDPRFVQQLLRFNQLDHINFNPILDTKALRKAYKRILNVDVPMVFKQYSKKRANVVNYQLIDEN